MRAEELLETLTDDELKRRANRCFLQAEDANLYRQLGPEERVRFLTEADFYLKALIWRQDARTAERDRQRNEEIAERDFRLERRVVWLIGAEIVLSVVFGVIGIYEAWKQGKVLDHMDASTSATATAMKAASTTLQTLAEEQSASLKILQQQEADRLTQLARRPPLVLYLGHLPLAKARGSLKPREETDTSATFDFVLKNVGEATANKVIWRALVPRDIFLNSNAFNPAPILANDLPDRPVSAYLFFQELIPPRGYTEVTITFVFPKGHPQFPVNFNASSPEIVGEAPLGVLTVAPRMPPAVPKP